MEEARRLRTAGVVGEGDLGRFRGRARGRTGARTRILGAASDAKDEPEHRDREHERDGNDDRLTGTLGSRELHWR